MGRTFRGGRPVCSMAGGRDPIGTGDPGHDGIGFGRSVVWALLLGLLAFLLLLLSTGCGAVAGSLGLAGADMVAGGLQTVQQFAAAKVAEVEARVVEARSHSEMYAAVTGALGAAVALGGRWLDHKIRGRGGGRA